MPELPEVETMRRGIAAAVGLRIQAAEVPRGRLRPLSMRPKPQRLVAELRDGVIKDVSRYGKRIALQLAWQADATPGGRDRMRWLIFEPRMTGLLLVAEPPTEEHVRLRLRGIHADGVAGGLLFWDRRGLGTVRLVDERELDDICGPQRLGPDALQVDLPAFIARLGHSARAVKVALLDQRAVAGIGNLYAAEMLHAAGIDPRTRCRAISRARWERLHTAMRRVLEEAVELEGSTLSDATYRTALNEPGRYQSRHRVYAREGKPCGECGTVIRRIIQAQRSTFFCPGCQSRRPRTTGSRADTKA